MTGRLGLFRDCGEAVEEQILSINTKSQWCNGLDVDHNRMDVAYLPHRLAAAALFGELD